MRKLFFLLSIPAIIFTACNIHPLKTTVVNNWATSKSMQTLNAGDSLYQFPKKQNDNFLFSFTGSSVLNINPDQTFTSLGIHQNFFFGKWKFNESVNSLILITKSDTCTLKILKLDDNEMLLEGKVIGYLNKDSIKATKAKEAHKPDTLIRKITLSVDNSYHSGGNEDYFALKNNLWRIKPKDPETPAQINKRISGSLRFAIMYLSAHQKDDQVSLEPIALPIVIAFNGVQMQAVDDSRQEWKEIFYDNIDAMNAYHILNMAFLGNFNVPQNKIGLDLDVDLLKQLLANIK
jgi:hypothetical protein